MSAICYKMTNCIATSTNNIAVLAIKYKFQYISNILEIEFSNILLYITNILVINL
jgi:hypothetical protein